MSSRTWAVDKVMEHGLTAQLQSIEDDGQQVFQIIPVAAGNFLVVHFRYNAGATAAPATPPAHASTSEEVGKGPE